MKKYAYTPVIFIVFLVSGLLLTNCSSSKSLTDRIKIEEDIVHATKRVKFEHKQYSSYFSQTPLISLNQTFVKTIKSNGAFVVDVYDKLTLKAGDFRIEDTVYMIIRDTFYPITPKTFEYEQFTNKSATNKKITTKDDEDITVVTGYRENNRDIVRINYQLSDKMIGAINTADTVSFRYYAGPNMITIQLKEEVLDAVKGVINFK